MDSGGKKKKKGEKNPYELSWHCRVGGWTEEDSKHVSYIISLKSGFGSPWYQISFSHCVNILNNVPLISGALMQRNLFDTWKPNFVPHTIPQIVKTISQSGRPIHRGSAEQTKLYRRSRKLNLKWRRWKFWNSYSRCMLLLQPFFPSNYQTDFELQWAQNDEMQN